MCLKDMLKIRLFLQRTYKIRMFFQRQKSIWKQRKSISYL